MAKGKSDKDLQQVNMSNALARAAHRLKLGEKRLVVLGIANTDQLAPLPKNSGWVVRIHASEYADQFGVDISAAYKQLRIASKRLYKREVSSIWQIKHHYDDEVEFNFRWVSSVKYWKSEGCVDLNFTPEVVPHLIDLKKRFAGYKLKQASSFKSIYAWRLYEVLNSHAHELDEIEFDIYEFRLMMEAPPSCSSDFGALRRVVIAPAIKEINKHSDIKILEVDKDKKGNPVYFEAMKKGRVVSNLRFKFKRDEQIKLPLDKGKKEKKRVYTKADLEANNELARPGETLDAALKRLNSRK